MYTLLPVSSTCVIICTHRKQEKMKRMWTKFNFVYNSQKLYKLVII